SLVTCRCEGVHEHGEDRGRGAWSAARVEEIAERLAAADDSPESAALANPAVELSGARDCAMACGRVSMVRPRSRGKAGARPDGSGDLRCEPGGARRTAAGGNLRPDHGGRFSALFAA